MDFGYSEEGKDNYFHDKGINYLTLQRQQRPIEQHLEPWKLPVERQYFKMRSEVFKLLAAVKKFRGNHSCQKGMIFNIKLEKALS